MGIFEGLHQINAAPSAATRHPKCRGFREWTDWGYEYDCGYGSDLSCEECKYGFGGKDPEAKCNQISR